MSRSRLVLAVLGPTASGKSALGLALAERVRRRDHQLRLDGRLSRLRHRHRQTVDRRAARHPASPDRHRRSDRGLHRGAVRARRRARRFATSTPAGRLPILVGGTGFYYRALTRGLFPGPGADEALRARLDRVAERKGPERLHRMLQTGRSRVGRADHAARPQAAGARARGVLRHRPAADRALRRDTRRRSRTARSSRVALTTAGRPDRRARRAASRPAVRARHRR